MKWKGHFYTVGCKFINVKEMIKLQNLNLIAAVINLGRTCPWCKWKELGRDKSMGRYRVSESSSQVRWWGTFQVRYQGDTI